jgi:hypothetical protein
MQFEQQIRPLAKTSSKMASAISPKSVFTALNSQFFFDLFDGISMGFNC